MRYAHRFLPLAILALAVIAVWASGLGSQLNWPALARNQAWLGAWITRHPIAAPGLYAAIYAAATALSLPEAAVLTVGGGLLFGTWLGGATAIVGSTTGAVILFAAARSAFASMMEKRAGPRISRLRAELHRNGFLYLLAIRLVPLFPFWLVNLAAALAGMRLLPYVGATLLGIIPATLIYAAIGSGIGDVLAAGHRPNLGAVFSPAILGPLLGLAALALLPILWRHWKRAHA
jgi:uncharacterized membrane protein YdjX (TVP38/TMEM64 family)